MARPMRTCVIALFVAAASAACAPQPKCAQMADAPPRVTETPRVADTAPKSSAPAEPPAVAIVRRLLGSDQAATYASFSERFREAVPIERIADGMASSEKALGKVIDLRLAEASAEEGRAESTVVAFRERGSEVFTVTLDDKGVLIGLRVKPLVEHEEEGPGPADAYVAKRTYVLPGKGAWYVANGGPTNKQNHHVGNKQQWYAFDIDKRDADGKDAKGDGKKNEDHFVFGEPVLAPADGTIVFVVDAVDDYPPGERERYFVPGNTVVIDHGDDEFSVLAHFKKGSIVVKRGQKVKVGQKLGQVGNSGNTSDPHIHWHLATQGGLSRGSGLPIRFGALLVNGKRVENPKPVKGDTIENVP